MAEAKLRVRAVRADQVSAGKVCWVHDRGEWQSFRVMFVHRSRGWVNFSGIDIERLPVMIQATPDQTVYVVTDKRIDHEKHF